MTTTVTQAASLFYPPCHPDYQLPKDPVMIGVRKSSPDHFTPNPVVPDEPPRNWLPRLPISGPVGRPIGVPAWNTPLL